VNNTLRRGARTAAIVGLGLTLAGLFLAPWLLGDTTEARFRALVDHAALERAAGLDWELRDYRRSWFGATATSELTLRDSGGAGAFTVRLHHDIDYAPTAGSALVEIVTRPDWPAGPAQRIAQALYPAGTAALTMAYTFRPGGQQRIVLRSPPTRGARPVGDGLIDWRGLTATLSLTDTGERLRYRLSGPGLTLDPERNRPGAIRVEGFHGEGTLAATRFQGIWTGDNEGTLERIELTGASGEVTLADLAWADRTHLEDGLIAARVEMTAKRFETPLQVLSNLKLTAAAERIEPTLVQALTRLAAGRRPETDTAALARVPWGRVAAQEPSLRVDALRAMTAKGPVAISGRASTLTPLGQLQGITLRDWLELLRARLQFETPRGLARRAIARILRQRSDADGLEAQAGARLLLRRLIQSGLVEHEAGTVGATARYGEDGFRINGRPLSAMR